jgi:tetratricopeptide (TPR) repeat protein
MTLTLCMIVRDEEAQLDRCLDSVRGVADEIVVVDTGSQDRTVEIARAHGARIVEFPWTDHFADARNAGLEVATGDWIFYLDADEALVAGDGAKLRAFVARRDVEGGTVLRLNRLAEGERPVTTNRTLRVFRNRPEHRFAGRIHEGVSEAVPQDRVADTGARIDHYGFDLRTRATRDKSRRNLDLLLREAAEEPESAFTQSNLAAEYAALDDHERAIAHSERALALLGDELPQYALGLHRRYVTALRQAGRTTDAIAAAQRAARLVPTFTDLWFEQAQAARAAGDLDTAELAARRALELGDATERYGGTVGAGSFRAAAVLAGVLRDRGDLAGAEQLLLQTLAVYPDQTALVSPLVGVMLGRGAPPEDVEAAVGQKTPAVRFELAAAFREAGLREAATAQLAAILVEAEGTTAAALAAAEQALDAGDWSAAAAAAERVPDADERAGQARLAAGTARLMLGDEGSAIVDLAAARLAGAPADGVALLAAWLDPDEPLTQDAIPALTLAFERCLTAGDADQAVRLLGVFERVEGLDPRSRRELLALLYLRHGMLDMAADEWAAAAEEHGPDAPLMLGLARVEAARGNGADALVFAEGALELDPSSTAARSLIDALRG